MKEQLNTEDMQRAQAKMKRLTKEHILEGINRKESLYIKDYNAEVVIHPLSDGELSKIFSLLGPLPLMPDGTPDTSKVELHKNFEALRLATSLGLVEPKLTLVEVASMKFGVPEYIGMRVLEISGVAPPETSKKKDAK
jgi:hypothetical protein